MANRYFLLAADGVAEHPGFAADDGHGGMFRGDPYVTPEVRRHDMAAVGTSVFIIPVWGSSATGFSDHPSAPRPAGNTGQEDDHIDRFWTQPHAGMDAFTGTDAECDSVSCLGFNAPADAVERCAYTQSRRIRCVRYGSGTGVVDPAARWVDRVTLARYGRYMHALFGVRRITGTEAVAYDEAKRSRTLQANAGYAEFVDDKYATSVWTWDLPHFGVANGDHRMTGDDDPGLADRGHYGRACTATPGYKVAFVHDSRATVPMWANIPNAAAEGLRDGQEEFFGSKAVRAACEGVLVAVLDAEEDARMGRVALDMLRTFAVRTGAFVLRDHIDRYVQELRYTNHALPPNSWVGPEAGSRAYTKAVHSSRLVDVMREPMTADRVDENAAYIAADGRHIADCAIIAHDTADVRFDPEAVVVTAPGRGYAGRYVNLDTKYGGMYLLPHHTKQDMRETWLQYWTDADLPVHVPGTLARCRVPGIGRDEDRFVYGVVLPVLAGPAGVADAVPTRPDGQAATFADRGLGGDVPPPPHDFDAATEVYVRLLDAEFQPANVPRQPAPPATAKDPRKRPREVVMPLTQRWRKADLDGVLPAVHTDVWYNGHPVQGTMVGDGLFRSDTTDGHPLVTVFVDPDAPLMVLPGKNRTPTGRVYGAPTAYAGALLTLDAAAPSFARHVASLNPAARDDWVEVGTYTTKDSLNAAGELHTPRITWHASAADAEHGLLMFGDVGEHAAFGLRGAVRLNSRHLGQMQHVMRAVRPAHDALGGAVCWQVQGGLGRSVLAQSQLETRRPLGATPPKTDAALGDGRTQLTPGEVAELLDTGSIGASASPGARAVAMALSDMAAEHAAQQAQTMTGTWRNVLRRTFAWADTGIAPGPGPAVSVQYLFPHARRVGVRARFLRDRVADAVARQASATAAGHEKWVGPNHDHWDPNNAVLVVHREGAGGRRSVYADHDGGVHATPLEGLGPGATSPFDDTAPAVPSGVQMELAATSLRDVVTPAYVEALEALCHGDPNSAHIQGLCAEGRWNGMVDRYAAWLRPEGNAPSVGVGIPPPEGHLRAQTALSWLHQTRHVAFHFPGHVRSMEDPDGVNVALAALVAHMQDTAPNAADWPPHSANVGNRVLELVNAMAVVQDDAPRVLGMLAEVAMVGRRRRG